MSRIAAIGWILGGWCVLVPMGVFIFLLGLDVVKTGLMELVKP